MKMTGKEIKGTVVSASFVDSSQLFEVNAVNALEVSVDSYLSTIEPEQIESLNSHRSHRSSRSSISRQFKRKRSNLVVDVI